MADFTPDQTVYLPDGREAIYVMRNGDQHFVQEVRQGFDPEEGYYMYHGPAVSVLAVRATYPTEAEKRDAKIAALRADLAKLENGNG